MPAVAAPPACDRSPARPSARMWNVRGRFLATMRGMPMLRLAGATRQGDREGMGARRSAQKAKLCFWATLRPQGSR